MESVVAVAFLVGCSSNLLICEDLPTPDHFADMEACGAALPSLIRLHEERGSGLAVTLGKCRLMLRPRPLVGPPEAPVVAASLR